VSDVWKLELCTLSTSAAYSACHNCSGTIRITRQIGCEPLIPNDLGTDRETRFGGEVLGPDEIFVLLEGPELLAPSQRHSGHCMYTFDFKFTIPGTYRLSATVIRSDWDGYWSGFNASFPPETFNVLTSSKQLLVFGNESQTLEAHAAVVASHSLLPPCLSAPDTSGRWVQVPLQHETFNTEATVPRPLGYGYSQSFFTDLHRLAWLPYACHWKQHTAIEASQCLSGKRILVHGDSQTQTLYNYMATTFCGIENAAVKGFLDTKGVNGSVWSTLYVVWITRIRLREEGD
jgi:hypothetical protein